MTESVKHCFTETIHIYFIQINISLNINISINCLFLEVVGPVTHQAVETNFYTALFSLSAQPWCVIGLTTSKNKDPLLKRAESTIHASPNPGTCISFTRTRYIGQDDFRNAF